MTWSCASNHLHGPKHKPAGRSNIKKWEPSPWPAGQQARVLAPAPPMLPVVLWSYNEIIGVGEHCSCWKKAVVEETELGCRNVAGWNKKLSWRSFIIGIYPEHQVLRSVKSHGCLSHTMIQSEIHFLCLFNI